MRNNNGKAIKKLSAKSLKSNWMRNLFAVSAIILTCMLFTAAFSLVSGMLQVAQEKTMCEVGGRFHAGLKAVTKEQYEKVASDPLVERSSYDIYVGFAENIVKRQAEIRYFPKGTNLDDYFIDLEEGYMPEKEDEIVVDTIILDELKADYKVGEKITLTFSFLGEKIEKEFTVSGWYEGNRIMHASELMVSEAYWRDLKGSLTDEDFQKWGEANPQDNGVGLYAGNLFFEKATDLEDKVRTVITNAGYEPETEIDYGVNWAYMTSRMDAADPMTMMVLAGAVLTILLTGYLIIYNIFQISVISDIRYYGLLKTIGTTKAQLKRLIQRQAMILSLIGIPIGLVIGYGIGKLALPAAMRISDTGNMKIELQFHPMILVFSIGFSALTVFLSFRRPGKIAGNVSPIEAVRYTEGVKKQKKNQHRTSEKLTKKYKEKRQSNRLFSMVWNNLGRNKGKTGAVVSALTLSMILLLVVTQAIGSLQVDSYLSARIVDDYMIASNSLFSTGPSMEGYEISEDYLSMADAQDGILVRNELWCGFSDSLKLDGKALARYEKLEQEGKLRMDEYSKIESDAVKAGLNGVNGYSYGYTDRLLSNLKVLEGELDIEKFQNGDYILLGVFIGAQELPAVDSLYHPGDVVTVESITDESEAHEIKNEEGEIINYYYDTMNPRQYEVMAIVEIPYSMDLHRYSGNAMDIVLPLREFKQAEQRNTERFAVSYQVEEQYKEEFESALKEYTENSDRLMAYASKDSLKKEFSGMIQGIAVIGISLSIVIAFIGILNFINAVITGILSRKRELAMLTSIGMTGEQMKKLLICEGISYILIAGVISFVIGNILSRVILSALNGIIMFFEYQFTIVPFLIMMIVLLAVAVVTPLVSYKKMQKNSIVERLRVAE